MTLEERVTVVRAGRCVDEVVAGAPDVGTVAFLRNHDISVVVHGDDAPMRRSLRLRRSRGCAMLRIVLGAPGSPPRNSSVGSETGTHNCEVDARSSLVEYVDERTDGRPMWLSEPLITERLRLRALAEGDRPEVVRLGSDEGVRRFLGGARSPADLEAALEKQPMGATWGVFAVADRRTDRVMGSVDLCRTRGKLEVSWVFLPEHWGAGFAYEAVTALLAWAFEQAADRRIIAVTQSANTASCKLAERLGMTREATFEEYGAEQVEFVLTPEHAIRQCASSPHTSRACE